MPTQEEALDGALDVREAYRHRLDMPRLLQQFVMKRAEAAHTEQLHNLKRRIESRRESR